MLGTIIIADSKISGKSSKSSECMRQPRFSHMHFSHILSSIVSDNIDAKSLKAMRVSKKAIDPKVILNPGKIFEK